MFFVLSKIFLEIKFEIWGPREPEAVDLDIPRFYCFSSSFLVNCSLVKHTKVMFFDIFLKRNVVIECLAIQSRN